MKRKEIRLADQLEKRKDWKRPMVDIAVATVIFREKEKVPSTSSLLDSVEFFVTERLKGAEKGQLQAHHGGYVDIADNDVLDAAARELFEETGYARRGSVHYVTSIGPALYRSELEYPSENTLRLHVSETEAEPENAFVLLVYCTKVRDIEPLAKTDGEVSSGTWMTPRSIIQNHGLRGSRQYSRFNYFQVIVPVLKYISGKWDPGTARASVLPGSYEFDLFR